MDIFIIAAALIFGAIVGSFLNVCVVRMNTGMGLGGRSRCFSCGHTLTPRELVPVMSFLVQKGRCRSCQSKISVQYILVELATMIVSTSLAIIFLVPFSVDGLAPFLFGLVVLSLFIIIAAYDIRHMIVPDKIIFLLLVMGILQITLPIFPHADIFGWGSLDYILGAFLVPLPFLIVWLVSRGEYLGFGDIKLMAVMGLFLGTVNGFGAVILGFWVGALAVLGVVLAMYLGSSKSVARNDKKGIMKMRVPFAPFLIAGFFLSVIGWNAAAYLSLIS